MRGIAGIDYPYDEDMNVAKMAEEPEHYRTERAARHAHELIEEMSRPKERKPPVEVQMSHRIGRLESDVEHLQREAESQYRRANDAEAKAADAEARAQQYQKEYNEWRNRALTAETRAEKAEKLHKDLLNKRRYRR